MHLVQGSPEWHEWRKSGVGASEVAAVLGIDPYGNTPYSTWLVKTGRAKGFEGNAFTEHGKETEAKARARYELKNMEDMPDACATHPKYPFLIASLDGWNQELRKVLEIKCPKGLSTLEMAEAGQVIGHYVPQTQSQLLVTGADDLDFFVYHEETGRDALVHVKPILEIQAEIVLKVGEFWTKYVLTDTPPQLTEKDVKIITDHSELEALCEKILAGKDGAIKKPALDELKARAIELAGHPKMRCGRVQISTVNRAGKFSFHKLTIHEGA